MNPEVKEEIKPEAILPQEKIADPAPNPDSPVEKKTEEDPNWRAFREARKKDREEREAAERRAAEKAAEVEALKAAMEAAFARDQKKASQSSSSYGYEQDESEEDRIKKHVDAALAAREAAYERARMEREHQEYPQRLSQTYPDFNAIMTSENLDYLEYHYPEIARPLKRLPEGFDKWSDTYQAIKKFLPNALSAKKDAARAEANLAKPKSISSSGASQSGDQIAGNYISEERRAANWAKMQKIMKGV